jgi:hypothetical protein
MGGSGAHGDGADSLEPTRARPIESAARSEAKALEAGGGCGTAEGDRPASPTAACGAQGTWGCCGCSWAARSSFEPQNWRLRSSKRFWLGSARGMRILDPRWPRNIWRARACRLVARWWLRLGIGIERIQPVEERSHQARSRQFSSAAGALRQVYRRLQQRTPARSTRHEMSGGGLPTFSAPLHRIAGYRLPPPRQNHRGHPLRAHLSR